MSIRYTSTDAADWSEPPSSRLNQVMRASGGHESRPDGFVRVPRFYPRPSSECPTVEVPMLFGIGNTLPPDRYVMNNHLVEFLANSAAGVVTYTFVNDMNDPHFTVQQDAPPTRSHEFGEEMRRLQRSFAEMGHVPTPHHDF